MPEDVKAIVREWIEKNVENNHEYCLTLEELEDLVSVAKCRFLTKVSDEDVFWISLEEALDYIIDNEDGTVRFAEWKNNLLCNTGKFMVVGPSVPEKNGSPFILEQKHVDGKWRIID